MDLVIAALCGFTIGAALMYFYHAKFTAQLQRTHDQELEAMKKAQSVISGSNVKK